MWDLVSASGSLAHRIVTQIEDLMNSASLRPGDQLPTERDLARLVGASRPTVREAIRILQARGRLDVRHGIGVFVIDPPALSALDISHGRSTIDIDELFSMREVLEVPAASWAAKIATGGDLQTLRGVLADLDRAFDSDPADFNQLARLDASFHLAIADIAGNQYLQRTSSVLHEILVSGMKTTLLIPGRREKSSQQHDRILQALASHDASEAARAARVHVQSARRAAKRQLVDEVGDDSSADVSGQSPARSE